MVKNKVLLLDGRAISCLSFARRLARSGMEVHVAESFRHNLTAYSNAVTDAHTYPSPDSQPEAFRDRLSELIEDEGFDFVIPIRDASTIHLASMRDRLSSSTNTLLADVAVIEQLGNKQRCAKLAERIGVDIPRTYYPDEQSLREIANEAVFPVLAKPTVSSGARGIRLVESPDRLETAYHGARAEYDDVMIQEYVDHAGGHFSIGTVFDRNSTPRAIHVYEELRQHPDSGGPAIRAVSVAVDEWVHEMLELFESIDWVGPAHMDVLFDPDDETYRLLEVNPRVWSSVALTIHSGVDVPNTVIEAATGAATSDPPTYETGVHYRWAFPNEILWALDGRETPSRLRRLLQNGHEPTCYGILSKQDPQAGVGALAQSLRFLLDPEGRRTIFARGWDDE